MRQAFLSRLRYAPSKAPRDEFLKIDNIRSLMESSKRRCASSLMSSDHHQSNNGFTATKLAVCSSSSIHQTRRCSAISPSSTFKDEENNEQLPTKDTLEYEEESMFLGDNNSSDESMHSDIEGEEEDEDEEGSEEIQLHLSEGQLLRIEDEELRKIAKIPVGMLEDQSISQSNIDSLCSDLLSNDNFFDAFQLMFRLRLELDLYIDDEHASDSDSNNHESAHRLRTMIGANIPLIVEEWCRAQTQLSLQENHKLYQGIPSPKFVWQRIQQFLSRGVSIPYTVLEHIMEPGNSHKERNNPPVWEEDMVRMVFKDHSEICNLKISTFNKLMQNWEAFAKQQYSRNRTRNLRFAADRILTLFNHVRNYGRNVIPNRDTFHIAMRVLAYQGKSDRVEELLEELYTTYLDILENQDSGNNKTIADYTPTEESFSLVLFALNQARDKTGVAAERASDILDRMLELERNQEFPGFQVTARCFDVVLKCWSNVSATNTSGVDKKRKMNTLYDRMVVLSELDPTKTPTEETDKIISMKPSSKDLTKEQAFAANVMLFDEARCRSLPVDTMMRFSGLMKGKIKYVVTVYVAKNFADKKLYETKVTYTQGDTVVVAEEIGKTSQRSRAAAALTILDELRESVIRSGEDVSRYVAKPANAKRSAKRFVRAKALILDEALCSNFPLQTLHNYIQVIHVGSCKDYLDYKVCTLTDGSYETKATYTNGSNDLVGEGVGETEQSSKNAAACDILNKLREDSNLQKLSKTRM